MRLTAFFSALRDMGARYAVVTDGQGGAFLGTGKEIVHCPIAKADVAGTAGAGDAFTSTFSAFIAMGRPVEDALRAATLNAAAVVAFVDTQSGLLHLDVLENHLTEAAPQLPLHRWTL